MKKKSATTTVKAPVENDGAVLPTAWQQRWKKRHGYCLVKGCREKATKGHFCAGHAAKRSRLKAKGVKIDEPIEFAAPKAAKKPAPAKPKAKAKKAVAPKKVKAPAAPKAKKAKKASLAPVVPLVETPANQEPSATELL